MEGSTWFSEAIKEQFHQRLRGNLENAKRKDVHLICIEKTHQPMIKNVTPKKYRQYWRTDQNPHHTYYRKEMISTKQKQNWAVPANVSLGRYDDDEMRHILTKYSKINPFSAHLNFERQLRNVTVIVQKEKIAIKNFNLRWKKFIPTLTIQLTSPEKQRKKEVCQFPSIMSEKNVSNNSRTCIHLRAIKVFLVFAGQKHVDDTSRVIDKEV